jgi:hypothetical protein
VGDSLHTCVSLLPGAHGGVSSLLRHESKRGNSSREGLREVRLSGVAFAATALRHPRGLLIKGGCATLLRRSRGEVHPCRCNLVVAFVSRTSILYASEE